MTMQDSSASKLGRSSIGPGHDTEIGASERQLSSLKVSADEKFNEAHIRSMHDSLEIENLAHRND